MPDLELDWQALESPVRGYLHRRLRGDDATVDDLMQEIFLRVRAHLGGLRDPARMGPWLMRIARHALIDHLRRQRPTAALEQATEPGTPTPADENALQPFARSLVESLPEHERAAVRLVDLDGLSGPEAARTLAIGLPALKARLRRGRERLRAGIERCCIVLLDHRGTAQDCEPRSPGSCDSCG